MGAIDAVKINAPATGGSFAAWAALFSTLECAFSYARGKEDATSFIAAGAVISGVLSFRRGARVVARHTVGGAVGMSILLGATFAMDCYVQRQESNSQAQAMEAAEAEACRQSQDQGSGSWT